MSIVFFSSACTRLFILSTIACLANLLRANIVWGQFSPNSNSTTLIPSIAEEKQNLSIPKLQQFRQYSTNAADLLLTCNYDDLLKVKHDSPEFYCKAPSEKLVQNNSTIENEPAESNILQPTNDRFKIQIGNNDPKAFNFGLGSKIGEPTALQGATRKTVVSASAQKVNILPIQGFIEQGLGANQRLLLEIKGDAQLAALDLSYTLSPPTIPGAFSVNAQTERSFVGVFESGDDVNLPKGADPWVHRSGGGVEYFMPFSPKFSLASAFNYQLVSVRPGAFTTQVVSRDELGNRVTVSDSGQDPLLTFNLSSVLTTVDDLSFPSQGSKLRLGIDTSIPIGDANISFGRFAGNFSQFIPINFFGFSEGSRTLIFNFQAGTMLGDVPPYEAFSLGGSSSIRGYGGGEVASGSSFLLASTEYRYPIINDLHLLIDFDLQGSLFFDYGTDLGTAREVIGEPAIVRNKQGNGFGYGLGLHAKTGFGLFRLEFAGNDQGNFTVHFTGGDRY